MTTTTESPRWECQCGMQHSQAAKYCSECEEAIGSALAWEWINTAGTTSDRRIAVARKARELLAPKLPSVAQPAAPDEQVRTAIATLKRYGWEVRSGLGVVEPPQPAAPGPSGYPAALGVDLPPVVLPAAPTATDAEKREQVQTLTDDLWDACTERDAEKERADRAERAETEYSQEILALRTAVLAIEGSPGNDKSWSAAAIRILREQAATIARLHADGEAFAHIRRLYPVGAWPEHYELDADGLAHLRKTVCTAMRLHDKLFAGKVAPARPELPAVGETVECMMSDGEWSPNKVRQHGTDSHSGKPCFWVEPATLGLFVAASEGRHWRRVAPEAKPPTPETKGTE